MLFKVFLKLSIDFRARKKYYLKLNILTESGDIFTILQIMLEHKYFINS